MVAALTLATAFLASVAGTRALIDWLTRRDLVAVENDRTMHQGRVPQGGGLAVMAAALAATVIFSAWSGWHWVLLPAGAALSALSLANDRKDIPFGYRLAAHFAAALLLVLAVPTGTPILGGLLPFGFDRAIVVVGIVWFINLYNFMDGIDGMAGTESVSIALGVVAVLWRAGLAAPVEGLALAIAGAAAGFLVWNWHKARIFMGDVGSIPLGFLLAGLLVYVAINVSLAAALILPLYYLVDATSTLLKRFWRGEKVWQAHRIHAYQRAARAVGSHAAVVVRVAACNAILVVAAVLAVSMPLAGLAVGVLATGLLMRELERMAAAALPAPAAAAP